MPPPQSQAIHSERLVHPVHSAQLGDSGILIDPRGTAGSAKLAGIVFAHFPRQ